MFIEVGITQEFISNRQWAKICTNTPEENKKTCHLSNLVQSQDSNINILLISIIKRENQKLYALLTAPLGISLAEGIEWQIDKARKQHFIFNTCTPKGCFSAIELTESRIKEMEKGLWLEIICRDGAKKSYPQKFL